jgi:hypothetical protein
MKARQRATAVALALTLTALPAASASAHTTGIHDNCTELQSRWPHGVGRKGAHDKTSGEPVTDFKRSTKKYNKAMSHNGTLDADKDGIACEKH